MLSASIRRFYISRASNFVNGQWKDSNGPVALERRSPLNDEVVGITPQTTKSVPLLLIPRNSTKPSLPLKPPSKPGPRSPSPLGSGTCSTSRPESAPMSTRLPKSSPQSMGRLLLTPEEMSSAASKSSKQPAESLTSCKGRPSATSPKASTLTATVFHSVSAPASAPSTSLR